MSFLIVGMIVASRSFCAANWSMGKNVFSVSKRFLLSVPLSLSRAFWIIFPSANTVTWRLTALYPCNPWVKFTLQAAFFLNTLHHGKLCLWLDLLICSPQGHVFPEVSTNYFCFCNAVWLIFPELLSTRLFLSFRTLHSSRDSHIEPPVKFLFPFHSLDSDPFLF